MADTTDRFEVSEDLIEKIESGLTEYEYEGIILTQPGYSPEIMDKIKVTAFDDKDIILATFIKCGTTLTQEIIYLVQTEGDFEGSDKTPVFNRFNYIEVQIDETPEYDRWAAKTPPRLVKTHLPSHFFKKTIDQKKSKFIAVFRNPKDMLVSFFHFYRMAPFVFDVNGTWEEFFDRFQNNKLTHGNYFDMQLSWWTYRDDPRFLILKYEDILKDPIKAIKQIASHLNKNLSDELIMKIAQRTSFKSMKENPMLNYSTFPHMKHEVSPFMRKGKVGDWKNYFTEEQRKFVDNLSKTKFESQGLFLEDE